MRNNTSTKKDIKELTLAVFVLPVIFGVFYLFLVALFSLQSNHATDLPAVAPDRAAITIEEVEVLEHENFMSNAKLVDENTIELIIGGSGTCPPILDKAYVLDNKLNLESTVRNPDQPCTDDLRMYGFRVSAEEPFEVESVVVNGEEIPLAFYHDDFKEGSTADGGLLHWGGLGLIEIDPVNLPEDESLELVSLLESDGRIAILSEDGHELWFSYGSNASCEVSFISLNVFENELELISQASTAETPCEYGFKPSYFKLMSPTPLELKSIRIQALEYPDQEEFMEISELVLD